jgi:YidC/Oxa1 family membrane protein insertase
VPPLAANPLQPLIDFFEAILVFFHDSVGLGWGGSIIALTVLVRACLLPLTLKQFRSMQNLAKFQPQIKELQKKYANDRERLNQEMMKFYRENKVNPLASCLPLLAQLPVFLALFYMLQNDLRLDICPDVNPPGTTNPQPCGAGGEAQFFFIPDLTNTATGGVLITLIVLYVGSQLASTLLMSTTTDKTQRMIFLALPFFFVIFVINFPAGLLVYWITTNLWTIVQQMIVKKRLGPMRPPGSEPAPGLGELFKQARGQTQTAPAQPEQRSRAKDREVVAASGSAPKAKARPTAPPPAPPRKKKKRSGRRR